MFLIFPGIPMLIILDGDGKLITSSGRAVVSGDKEGKVGNFEVLLVFIYA
jgi:hypothetical protein